MRLTMKERQAVTKKTAERYRRAGKKQKGQMLDEFVALTGYNRWYAVGLLRGGRRRSPVQPPAPRRRGRSYDDAVLAALKRIWMVMDCVCGKRLVAVLSEVVPILERHGELEVTPVVRRKLLTISASTIDRLLAGERQRLRLRGRSGTKPGSLLRHQIPIRTFCEWDHTQPGFVEIDLVGHDGGVTLGDYCYTLDATDVASGWTETQAVANRAQDAVFAALKQIRARLPFPLKGIDSDNGSEFINDQLLRYVQQEQLTFTRGRAWKKNDGCFVEQKNYSVVRRAVGYARYQGPAALRLLNELYAELRLHTNFFQPVMKLLHKERRGAKVKKTYDRPTTPYRRLLASSVLDRHAKRRLREQYRQLNPAALRRNILELQHRLRSLSLRLQPIERIPTKRPRNHPWNKRCLAQISG
jgi:hypothetical protein